MSRCRTLRPVPFLSAIAAVALLLGGCAGTGTPSPNSSSPSRDVSEGTPSTHPDSLEGYQNQQLTWTSCGDRALCATAMAPLDWTNPAGPAVNLALKKLPATSKSKRIGTLFINPGGPGGSGVDMIDDASYYFSSQIQAAYDIVGWDPRGVGHSTAVTCYDDAQMDAYRQSTWDGMTDAGLAEGEKEAKDYADACMKNSGDLLGYVDTGSTVQDLDLLRELVGDPKLNYVGFSYGTYLGAEYADKYPDKVGRFVLDGAMDPALSYEELGYGQAAAFEASLRGYVKDCQTQKSCPLTGSVDDGIAQIDGLLAQLKQSPMKTNDPKRPLTDSLAITGIILTQYTDQYWPDLTQALQAALQHNDGAPLLALADIYADRQPDGTYTTNSTAANMAINCLDYPIPSDAASMRADEEKLASVSPTFGPYMAFGGVGCAPWPYPPVGSPAPVSAPGAGPIVVVGTTGDPATPYEWAQSLTNELESATLITYKGWGHTAYRTSNTCVAGLVDSYLLQGDVPAEGSTC